MTGLVSEVETQNRWDPRIFWSMDGIYNFLFYTALLLYGIVRDL